jgi:hypothetical protein
VVLLFSTLCVLSPRPTALLLLLVPLLLLLLPPLLLQQALQQLMLLVLLFDLLLLLHWMGTCTRWGNGVGCPRDAAAVSQLALTRLLLQAAHP